MKKLLFVCALASFAFVGCKCNKPVEAVAETEEVEVVAEEAEAEGEEVAEAEVAETPAEEVAE